MFGGPTSRNVTVIAIAHVYSAAGMRLLAAAAQRAKLVLAFGKLTLPT